MIFELILKNLKMKKLALVLSALFCMIRVHAQIEGNLVPNGSFEETEKKVKEPGQIELATPWKSATLQPADLYSSSTKKEEVAVPRNTYGEEKPLDGENYAGIRMYSDKDRQPRSYLYVELTEALEAGKTYCVTMNVSFADMSKFAVNNLGIYLSEDELTAKNTDILSAKPQVMQRTNRIFNKQFYWEPICAEYKAKGGEQYLTIGNFFPSEDTKNERTRRPKGFFGAQMTDGYYYIDQVSVVPMDIAGDCWCEKGPQGKMEVVKREFHSDPDAVQEEEGSDQESLQDMVIAFDYMKTDIGDSLKKKLDKAVEELTADEDITIQVVGHMDPSEQKFASLGQKRAENVAKYLESKGIDAERMEVKNGGTKSPIDTSGTEEGKAKNCRVEFVIPE